VTGQHLLLLLWTLWLVFALLSIANMLGVILALVYVPLGVGLILTNLATWRGYVIAWLIAHALVAGYTVAVLRGWLRPVSGRRGLRALWGWADSSLLQTIFGSVSFVGLLSVLYLRPTVPWKYVVDIPLMILAVLAVVGAEYALLAGSWRFKEREMQEQLPVRRALDPLSDPVTVPVEGKVVRSRPRPAADTEASNSERIDGLEFRLRNVERFLLHQRAQDGDAQAPPLGAMGTVWFHASGEVGPWARPGGVAPGAIRVELLRIAKLTARQEGSKGIAGRVVGINAMADRVVGITIERKRMPVSPKPDERTVREVIRRAVEKLSHEIETSTATPGTAQVISLPDWEVVSARWVHAGLAGVTLADKTVTDLGANLNSIFQNEPVQRVFFWNAPGSAAAVIGKEPEEKQILHIGGIIVGTGSGQPIAIGACFRSLARNDLTRSLAAGIARELGALGLTRADATEQAPAGRLAEGSGRRRRLSVLRWGRLSSAARRRSLRPPRPAASGPAAR
jgi:hypothetical protein